MLGIGVFISLAIYDIGNAFIALFAIIMMSLFLILPILNIFLNIKDEIEKIYNNINDMYEF